MLVAPAVTATLLLVVGQPLIRGRDLGKVMVCVRLSWLRKHPVHQMYQWVGNTCSR